MLTLSTNYKQLKLRIMAKYECDICGYIYDTEVGDPKSGIAAGTPFEELPEEWVCPLCDQGVDVFTEL